MTDQVNPLVLAGGGAVVVAVAIIAFSISNNDDPPKGTCELGSAGVALVATGLSHGENAKAISSALSGVGASVACNAAVDSLKQDPSHPVKVTINGTPQNVDSYQLQQMLAEAQRRHSIACLDSYGFGTQNDLDCLSYKIAPTRQ